MLSGFFFGSLFWFIFFLIMNHKIIKPLIRSKKYASARWDKATNQWRIIGDLSAVVEQINKSQHERPGSVKYVD